MFQIDGDTSLKLEFHIKVFEGMLNDKLNFNQPVNTTRTNAVRQLNALVRTFRFLSTKSRVIIYDSFTKSGSNYC